MNVKPSKAGRIVEMRLAGLSRAAVAQVLGVTPEYVSACTKGVTLPPAVEEAVESPVASRARVACEVAEGKRCSRCWLLLPCDHQ